MASLFIAGLLSFLFLLPRFIETRIQVAIEDQLSTKSALQVFSLGMQESSIGNMAIGDEAAPAISIASIQARYSLKSLFERKLEMIHINGLTLHLEISDNEITFPGIDLKTILDRNGKPDISNQVSQDNVPVLIDALQVSNGLVNVLYENNTILVPFDLSLKKIEQEDKQLLPVYALDLQLSPQGERILINGSVDLSGNRTYLTFSADSFDLSPLVSLFGDLNEFIHVGNNFTKGSVEINHNPFQLVNIEVTSVVDSARLQTVPIIFGLIPGSNDSNSPLRLKISGNGHQWNLVADASVNEPVSALISIDGSINSGKESVDILANLQIDFAGEEIVFNTEEMPVVFKNIPFVSGKFSAEIKQHGAWRAKLEKNTANEVIGLSYGPNNIKAGNQSLTLEASGDDAGGQANASIRIVNIDGTIGELSEYRMPAASLLASFNYRKSSGQENLLDGDFSIELPGVNFKRDTVAAESDLTVEGTIKPQIFNGVKSLQLGGELAVRNAAVQDSGTGLKINSIAGIIPWQLSTAHDVTGQLTAKGITFRSKDIGSFESGISLRNSIYTIKGRFFHSLLSGLVTNIYGQAVPVDRKFLTEVRAEMDAAPFQSLHLGVIDSSLEGAYMDGELGLSGSFIIDANGAKGNMSAVIQNGHLEFPEKDYEVNNISARLILPSLPVIRSGPAQQILFDKASVGDLNFDQGRILWQLESSDTIFIEEGVFNWAGGRIFTNAVRISPQMKGLMVPVFCDRLKLTEILHQFGVSGAEGEGTVSGRVPLQFEKKMIRVEDGFLFSSPGQGGSIKITAMDVLSAGIPKNTPQFAQIDFAAEALKNFQYNWVKLLLNSEDEDLVMQMQMDGKPFKSLPFSYDTRTGYLQRVDDGTKSINQPIRLDINFRLPMNKLMGYSGKIQDIFDQIQ
jgi:hypothetical protein